MAVRSSALFLGALFVLGLGAVAWALPDASTSPAAPDPALAREIHDLVFGDADTVAERVRDALTAMVETPDRVHLTLTPAAEAARRLAGGFATMEVELAEATVKGLRVESARFRISDATLDWEQLLRHRRLRLRDAGTVDLAIAVREGDLRELFRVKSGKLHVRNPRIDLQQGRLRFTGGVRALFFDNKVDVAGVLSVRDGTKVDFHPRWMNLDLLPIPGFILTTLARRINPIADFDGFAVPVRLSSIRITDDHIYLGGGAWGAEPDRMAEAEGSPDEEPAGS